MSQLRDLAEALVDALDQECHDSHAVIPDWLRTDGTGDICLACLLQGLIDRLEIHASQDANALARELRLLKSSCDAWHEDSDGRGGWASGKCTWDKGPEVCQPMRTKGQIGE